MANEFDSCIKDFCFANTLEEKGFVALWPQEFLGVQTWTRPRYDWALYVRWGKEHGSKVRRFFCEAHHTVVMQMFQTEALSDRQEQEATDTWLAKTNSRMWVA